jgi:hypothetical protein
MVNVPFLGMANLPSRVSTLKMPELVSVDLIWEVIVS